MAALELTRRDLLAAYLGAPFAAIACRERAAPLPPGSLVGTSHEVGHRLRSSPVRPERWESHDVVIVGAGVAGLAAAWRLGGKTLVLELEPEIGGTSRSSPMFPWGAHYVVAPSEENVVLAKLLEEMGVMHRGVIGEEFLVRDPEERIFYRGRWYEGLYLRAGATSEDLRQLAAFEAEIASWSKKRTFVIPIAYSTAEADELDRMSMREWLDRRGYTSPRLRWLIEYACRDDYGTLLSDTSAWAALFYFASRDDRPVITWPEGNGRVVSFLARYATIRTGVLVTRVVPASFGSSVPRSLGPSGSSEDPRTRGPEEPDFHGVEIWTDTIGIRARHVILATPQFITARLVEDRHSWLSHFTYGSWMVANLHLRDRPRSSGFPLAWDNVLYESPSLGYVVATHQRGIDHGPTVLTYYYPLCDSTPNAARERLLAAGRDEWAEIALADLSRAHPEIRSLTQRVDVMRWGHAMIRPVPGFVRSASLRSASPPIGNVHFANTDLSGVALFEEALWHGVRAAEEVA